MKSSAILKTGMCLAAVSMLFSYGTPLSKAASINTEIGIAGISVSLDKYYNSFGGIQPHLITDNNVVSTLAHTDTIDDLQNLSTRSLPGGDAAAEETNDAESTEEDVEEKQMPEPVSEYEHTGISIADYYVNIRKKPNTESDILGKLYKGCAATITATKGDWVKIKSGTVEGYIKSEYLAIGFDAEELIDTYGTKLATVNTTTLKVREERNTDSRVLTLIPIGETYEVIKEYDEWVKISIDDDVDDSIKGFISKEYVDITVEFEEAISIEEEAAKLAAEEAARKAEEEQLRKLAEQQAAAQQAAQNQNRPSNSSSSSHSSSSSNSSSSSRPSNSSSNSSNSSSSSNSTTKPAEAPNSGSGRGSDIASYARKFVGNPYVYGGTSLTSGADCSGFTQAVYRSFGVSIPRDSRSQASGAGSTVSLGSLKAGDLVFYAGSSGRVNHVAIYIGGGQVVHASNPRTGIKVSSVNYRTPCKARRVIN